MVEPMTRAVMAQRVREAAASDARIVGLLDYGSSSEGRSDEWSDLDLAVFVRDADFDAFEHDWKAWAGQFGDLLNAYIGGVGHPWTIYRATPVPLRVDFAFHKESTIAEILMWPNGPTSVDAMVWLDKTGGHLTDYARQLVGKRDLPTNIHATFDQVCGDFWYYILFGFSKYKRGDFWTARQIHNYMVLGNLIPLLRIEAGMLDRWMSSQSATGLERWLAPDRLAGLNKCIPPASESGLHNAMATTARFGRKVCEAITATHGWNWPHELGDEVIKTVSGASL